MKHAKAKANAVHPDDVSIGPGEWIRFVDVTGRTDRAVNIDPLLQPMESFWRGLEVHCVSECCGIGALGFRPPDIWNAARSCRDAALSTKLIALRQHVANLSADCVHSAILNQYFDRTMFSTLLDHVFATVDRMASGR